MRIEEENIMKFKIGDTVRAKRGAPYGITTNGWVNRRIAMKGYKVFDPDWKCRGFQYAVGETFEENVTPSCCNRGFHFCTELKDCFNYYSFDPDNKVAEIEALGEIDAEVDGNKYCTNKIKIVREISWEEVLRLVNTGKANAGLCNSGDCNSGDWNKTDFSSGCFNTVEAKILLFNKPSNWTFRDWYNSDARRLLNSIPKWRTKWICAEDMTEQERSDNPTYKITGGYLKILDESEEAQKWWDKLSDHNRKIIKAIPNFDPDIFEQCTGINVNN